MSDENDPYRKFLHDGHEVSCELIEKLLGKFDDPKAFWVAAEAAALNIIGATYVMIEDDCPAAARRWLENLLTDLPKVINAKGAKYKLGGQVEILPNPSTRN